MKPVVSVVMPVLNAAPYLAAAIESILGQSFADLELIVVDDGSDDSSLEIAAGYARRDRRVHHIALPRDPQTTSGARASNAGIAIAQGDYIARMDADDIAVRDRLALQLELMRERQLDVCGGRAVMFGDREGEIWYPQSQAAIRHELVFRSGLPNATMLARAVVIKGAPYDETAPFEEYELQTRLILTERIENSPGILLRLRVHPNQTTRVLLNLKLRSRWRSRFRYFFQLFPDAGLTDFRVVNAVADRLPLDSIEQLEIAGSWLVRLSRLPEVELRQRVARRWARSCDLATVADARLEPLRAEIAAQIAAAPS
jgi:glycosyltransferase involved in cell wall biosynthesis